MLAIDLLLVEPHDAIAITARAKRVGLFAGSLATLATGAAFQVDHQG
jgi:hypothetical protein